LGSGVVGRIVRCLDRRAAVESWVRAAMIILPATGASSATIDNGQRLYGARCAMCHGAEARGDGPLARKSSPPTPDLTTTAFRKRLALYPGVIVSSLILQPNGDLIPRTLRANGYHLPSHRWTVADFRDLDRYMKRMIDRATSRPTSARGGK